MKPEAPVISLFFALFSTQIAHAEIVEKTVAIVNNELVLESDFKDLDKRISKPGLIDESLLPDKNVGVLRGNRKNQLDYLVNERLIQSEIKRLNFSVTEDRIQSEIKEMAKRNNVSEVELFTILKGQGTTPEDYKIFLKESLEKHSLFESEISSKLHISDEDAINEYLKNNPNSKPSIDEFSVSHILFSPKNGGSEEALKRAEVVLRKLKSGESFENLAQQFSEDPNFSAGGSLGTFKAGEFLPEIEDSISNLTVGQTSGIVKSRIGYHIVLLTGRKLTSDPNFEKVKDRIKAQLTEYYFKRHLKVWLQNKRDEAFIRINE